MYNKIHDELDIFHFIKRNEPKKKIINFSCSQVRMNVCHHERLLICNYNKNLYYYFLIKILILRRCKILMTLHIYNFLYYSTI